MQRRQCVLLWDISSETYVYMFNRQLNITKPRVDILASYTVFADGEKMLFVAFMCIFFGTLALFLLRGRRDLKGRPVPGPQGWPIVGVAFQISSNSFHTDLGKLAEEFGEIMTLNVFGQTLLVLNSENMIHKAFNGDEGKLLMNDRPIMYLHRFFPEESILMATNGHSAYHSQLRKGFTKGFHVYGDGIKVFEETVQAAIGNLLKVIDSYEGKEFDCLSVVRNSIISLISVFLSGEELDPTDRRFSAIWKYVMAIVRMSNFKTNAVLSTVPFAQYLPGDYSDVHNDIQDSLAVIYDEYFTKMKKTHAEGSTRGIIDFLLDEQLHETGSEDESIYTDERIKGVIADVVLGGVLTTTSSVSSMILCLLHHPDVQRRVQAEIHEMIGRDRLPTIEDKAKCPYTEAVFMETQRYISVVPYVFHVCKDHISFEGYDIPANTIVLPNFWRMHHNEETWGDPWNFRPERFLDEQGQLLPRTHPLRKSWIPFSTGRRQCIGEPFGRSRIFLYIASLMQKWRFIPIPDNCGSCDPRSEQFDNQGLIVPKPFFCRVEDHT